MVSRPGPSVCFSLLPHGHCTGTSAGNDCAAHSFTWARQPPSAYLSFKLCWATLQYQSRALVEYDQVAVARAPRARIPLFPYTLFGANWLNALHAQAQFPT